MIKSENGNIFIKGAKPVIYADLGIILDELIRSETFNEKQLKNLIDESVKLKGKTDEEIEKDMEEELKKFLKNFLS